MRVTSVELHPAGSTEVCVLSFRDPRGLNPYNVKGMSGLDASDGIAPKFYGVSANSVAKFFNLSLQKREVGLSISLSPNRTVDETYSDLRDDLYRMIASSRTGLIQIQFKNETGVVAAISGFVTKLEAPHFEKTPEVEFAIQAVDPWLKAPAPVNVDVVGLNLADVNIQDLLSTAPHGFDFQMTFLANLASINISDPTDGSWSFVVTPVGGFLTGDVLHFSSDPSNKLLYIVRGAATIYLADVIAPGSIWPILFPRDNHFGAVSPGSMHIDAISYYPTYWGV